MRSHPSSPDKSSSVPTLLLYYLGRGHIVVDVILHYLHISILNFEEFFSFVDFLPAMPFELTVGLWLWGLGTTWFENEEKGFGCFSSAGLSTTAASLGLLRTLYNWYHHCSFLSKSLDPGVPALLSRGRSVNCRTLCKHFPLQHFPPRFNDSGEYH